MGKHGVLTTEPLRKSQDDIFLKNLLLVVLEFNKRKLEGRQCLAEDGKKKAFSEDNELENSCYGLNWQSKHSLSELLKQRLFLIVIIVDSKIPQCS